MQYGSIGESTFNGFLTAIIFVAILCLVFRRVFRSKTAAVPAISLDVTRKAYLRARMQVGLIFLAILAICTPVFSMGLHAFAVSLRSAPPPGAAVLYTQYGYWALVALSLSFCVSPLPANWLGRYVIGADFDKFQAYEERRQGFRESQFLLVLTIVLFPMCLFATIQGTRCRIELDTDALKVQRLLSLRPKIYAFTDISCITSAPAFTALNRRIIHRRVSAIHFRDGTSWNTDAVSAGQGADAINAGQDAQDFVQLVSRRSGVPVKTVSLLQRGDL